MACELPVTTCRIYLLSPNGDQLLNYGDYPIRPLHGWDEDDSQGQPILPLPSFQKALESGQAQLLHRDGSEHLPEAEKAILFFDVIKTVCLIPLIAKQARLGVIAVGEARNLKREPFTKEKLDLLQALATQISTLIHNAQLYQESARQAERLEVLNEVTKAIGSTIELESLLELIYEQLRKVLPADTYFVSLYEAEENILDMRILIDDGERFPPRRYPAGHGLSSWVLQNRQPLLLRHMSEESASQPVKGILLGKARRSESWLGTPILVGDQPLGLLAIASYTPKAFDESDVTLLSNIASQASVALDNARQHAAVKEQARRDSLTGVYNHGHLLIRLEEEVAHGQEQGTPVSLIMLDIDHFKKYNDTYGHVVGDQVLRLLADAIQAHVKKTDAVGRWGGEEFAVALAGATTDQAVGVAERIRNTLASLELFDKNGERLPNPTASQGIATFPFHAQDAAKLVDVADMALYRAKGMGRDQIMIADA
jgi:diguanylate cyclase (GGDEF)-like protein